MILLALVLSSCGSGAGTTAPDAVRSTAPSSSAASDPNAPSALAARLSAIDQAITRWQSATGLSEARAAAEEARNFIVGPGGPYFGDAGGDGTVGGASDAGLLPGFEGKPGVAAETDGPCVERDVLGGSWADPAARWATLDQAITAWSPSNNTFPALPSHPQRIVGWSTLALATDDLATALEYGGHARLHIDISTAAVTDCR